MLGNTGTTVTYLLPGDRDRPTHQTALDELRMSLPANEVESLVFLDCNPVSTLPDGDLLGMAIERVPTSIHFGLHADETAEHCKWHVPQAHLLETWSDLRSADGHYSLVQPLIAPLYDGLTRATAAMASDGSARQRLRVSSPIVRSDNCKFTDISSVIREATACVG